MRLNVKENKPIIHLSRTPNMKETHTYSTYVTTRCLSLPLSNSARAEIRAANLSLPERLCESRRRPRDRPRATVSATMNSSNLLIVFCRVQLLVALRLLVLAGRRGHLVPVVHLGPESIETNLAGVLG